VPEPPGSPPRLQVPSGAVLQHKTPAPSVISCVKIHRLLGLPPNLVVAWALHVLSGVLLIAWSMLPGGNLSNLVVMVLLLLLSCLLMPMIFKCQSIGWQHGEHSLCRKLEPDLEAPSSSPEASKEQTVETPFRKVMPLSATDQCTTNIDAAPMQLYSAELCSQIDTQLVGRDVVVEAEPSPSGNDVFELPLELRASIGTQTESNVCKDGEEQEEDEDAAPQVESVVETAPDPSNIVEQAAIVISPDATMLDGIRTLMTFHLKRAEIHTMSDYQSYMVESHVERLAGYGQNIISNIAFAQRALAQAQENEAYRAAEQARLQLLAEEEASLKKPQKKLKLDDGELLMLVSRAQQEAELEADWRGLPAAAPRGRMPAPPVSPSAPSQVTASNSNPSPSMFARGASLEREEAIGLLGQAFAARELASQDSLAAASEDLATRLIPARAAKPCDEVIRSTGVPTWCLPKMAPEEEAASSGLSEMSIRRDELIAPKGLLDGEVTPHFRIPPPADKVDSNSDTSAVDLPLTPTTSPDDDAVIVVTPADVRGWLEAVTESGNAPNSQHPSSRPVVPSLW